MNNLFRPAIFFIGMWLLSGCEEPATSARYTPLKPVIVTRSSLERSIIFQAPEKIGEPARILFKDNFMYVSERGKGIHVINNADKTKPVNTGYIQVPGCVDMVIKGNILYADNATDLVAIDLSNIASQKINITKRIASKFGEAKPYDGKEVPELYLPANRPAGSVIIGWKAR